MFGYLPRIGVSMPAFREFFGTTMASMIGTARIAIFKRNSFVTNPPLTQPNHIKDEIDRPEKSVTKCERG
jgi:hypothetical protein